MLRRLFVRVGVAGIACAVVSTLLPITFVAQGPFDRYVGPPLIRFYEGWVVIAIAFGALIALLLAYSDRRERLAGAVALALLAAQLGDYASGVSTGRLMSPCLVEYCPLTSGLMVDTETLEVAPPGIAFDVAFTGVFLLLASGIGLALTSRQRVAVRPVPAARDPIWL